VITHGSRMNFLSDFLTGLSHTNEKLSKNVVLSDHALTMHDHEWSTHDHGDNA